MKRAKYIFLFKMIDNESSVSDRRTQKVIHMCIVRGVFWYDLTPDSSPFF